MNKAFSLVELSIVLVILGLLVGGVLTGQSLIRAAELRSVSTEFQQFQTAVLTFRDRFFALPGDMRNAEDFWGSATCPAGTGTGTQTCNGGGDGSIGNASSAGNSAEFFQFWRHLANAGLIEGNYTGRAGAAGSRQAIARENIPPSRFSQAAWHLHNFSTQLASSSFAWPGNYGHVFVVGAVEPTDLPEDNVFTPEEAWNIDTKLDDGMPALGFVRNYKSAAACNTESDAANAALSEYPLNNSAVSCFLVFTTGF